MNKNVEIVITESSQKEYQNKEKKPKRIEWLNLYSKGFIIESINNNYINENNNSKKKVKKGQKNKIIFQRNSGSNTIKSNISTSILSSKKTYNLDEEDDIFNKNKTSLIYINNNILSDRNSNKKDEVTKNELNNNFKKSEKKIVKNNSVRNFKYTFTEKVNSQIIKNKNIKKNRNKSIKMNSKIIFNKKNLNNIFSPLLSYLEFSKNKIEQKSFNNQKNKKTNKNHFSFINPTKNPGSKTINKKENKKKININNNQINIKNNNLYLDLKSIKEFKIDNINLIEIQQYQKYMVDGRKFKNQKNKYKNQNKNDSLGEFGDYTFDDEDEDKLTMSERKNIISFSEICNPKSNFMTNNKEKII